MVKKIVLLDKIYNISSVKRRKDITFRYQKYLRDIIKGFPKTSIKLKKLREFDNRFEVIITGPEELFVYNLLKKEIGTITYFSDVKIGTIFKGKMVDVGKVGFGIFIDCGILNPKVDVLLNLHTLRRQLCNNKQISIKQIVNTYDFIDNFPLSVKILKKNIEKKKLEGEIDSQSLDLFGKVIKENIEGLFLSGETKGQLKKAIEKSGHFRDIISIERFGFLENILLLKEGTDAPGIISHIGKNLKNCKLSTLRPKRIKQLIN